MSTLKRDISYMVNSNIKVKSFFIQTNGNRSNKSFFVK